MRITQETDGAVAEFGLRRAQGPRRRHLRHKGKHNRGLQIDIKCVRRSDVRHKGKRYPRPQLGYELSSEIEAFRKYAEIYPDNCILLVDTYDTLRSGVPNAITVFNELKAKGKKPLGIRLDSGDLCLFKQAGAKGCWTRRGTRM